MANPNLTAERLRQVLIYNEDTGLFTWRISRPKCSAGSRAGRERDMNGYWQIKIDYCLYYSHRLAWLYMTGHWPSLQIDHIDGNKGNNRWDNLREVNTKQNQENRNSKTRSKSGVRGVDWSDLQKQWRARIGHHCREIHLGWFATFEEAKAASDAAELALYTHSKVSAPLT